MLITSSKYTVAVSDEKYQELVEDAKKDINVLKGLETADQVARGRILSDAASCIEHQKTFARIKELLAHIDVVLNFEEKSSDPSYYGLLGAEENRIRYIDFNSLADTFSTEYIAWIVDELYDPILLEEYKEWLKIRENA